MPPRFQQQQLASPVVGTPGLDQSAGVVERQIAQSADAMAEAQAAGAMQDLRQAEQSFVQGRQMFQAVQAQNRMQARLDKQIEDEQRRERVKFDRLDEDGYLNDLVQGLQDKHKGNPYGAVEEYKQQLPLLTQDFQNRYAADPVRLKMLQSGQRTAFNTAKSHLEQWAQKTETENLNSKFALMPEQMKGEISKLTGSRDQQLLAFQSRLMSYNQIYDSMGQSSRNDATKNEILTKQLKFTSDSSGQFFDHMIAQTPEGEAGLKHIDWLTSVAKSAPMFGIPMDPKDQVQLLGKLKEVRNAEETGLIEDIKGDTTIRVLDANKLKVDLYNAANDPKALANITHQVQSRLSELDGMIAQVSKEPESRVRNAKLAGLKQQQNTFVTELGMDLKLTRSFEQLQRTLTSFAQSQLRFQQSQITFQQGQLRFAQGQEDRAANAAKIQQLDGVNQGWATIQQELAAAKAKPAGLARQAEISKIVEKGIQFVNQHGSSGVLSAKDYGSRLDSLKSEVSSAQAVKTTKDWFGNVKTVPLKEADARKAKLKSEQDFGKMVERETVKFNHMQTAATQLHALTTNKLERAQVQMFLDSNMPTMLNSKAFQALPPAQQQKEIAKSVMDTIKQHRSGTLSR